MKSVKILAGRALLFAASLALALLVLEGAVRWLAPSHLWQYRDTSMDWQRDAGLGWTQRPHLDVSSRTEHGWTVRFRTNADGLTPESARRARTPGTVRILIFGDSTVVGRSVPQDQAVHARLQEELAARGHRVEVFNAGVEGYSTDQVLLRMRRLLPLYRPDIVLYGFCANDFGGNAVREAFGVPKPSFALGPGGALREIPPPAAPGARFSEFTTGPARWLQRSALYRLARPALVTVRARLGGWESRNLLGLAPEMYYQPEFLDRFDWPLFSSLLDAMREEAERHGGRLYLYAHPDLAEAWDPFIRDTEERLGLPPGRYDRYALERRLRRVSEGAAVPFCELVGLFAAHQESGPFHLLPRDPHCNPAGYRLTARGLAACLTRASGGLRAGGTAAR